MLTVARKRSRMGLVLVSKPCGITIEPTKGLRTIASMRSEGWVVHSSVKCDTRNMHELARPRTVVDLFRDDRRATFTDIPSWKLRRSFSGLMLTEDQVVEFATNNLH